MRDLRSRVLPVAGAHSLECRRALGQILRDRAEPILETVLAEGARASSFIRVGEDLMTRTARIAEDMLPLALGSLEADDPEREMLLRQLARHVHEEVQRGVPPLVQRGLARIGFRLAREVVRSRVAATVFSADELEDELRTFQECLERALFASA